MNFSGIQRLGFVQTAKAWSARRSPGSHQDVEELWEQLIGALTDFSTSVDSCFGEGSYHPAKVGFQAVGFLTGHGLKGAKSIALTEQSGKKFSVARPGRRSRAEI